MLILITSSSRSDPLMFAFSTTTGGLTHFSYSPDIASYFLEFCGLSVDAVGVHKLENSNLGALQNDFQIPALLLTISNLVPAPFLST